MVKRKNIRERGKISFSRAFQELNNDDSVAVDREPSLCPRFPKRLQGRTGKVIGKRGNCVIVEIKQDNSKKSFIINPIHLKRIKNSHLSTENVEPKKIKQISN